MGETRKLADQTGVDFNILTVVTAQTAKHIREVYSFFMAEGLPNQQYIPCLDPAGETPGRQRYSLTPKGYARFLRELFEPWYRDRKADTYVYIRYFENLAGILAGYTPESCEMNGVCSLQYAIEADGSVYPCDFHMLDVNRLGNIHTDSMGAIDERRRQNRFIERSSALPSACRNCRWLPVCRGGCYRAGTGGMACMHTARRYGKYFPISFHG